VVAVFSVFSSGVFFSTEGYFAPKFPKGKSKFALAVKFPQPSTGACCRVANKSKTAAASPRLPS